MAASIEHNILGFASLDQYAGTPYGISLLALNMLDEKHVNMKVSACFTDVDSIEATAEQLIGVWLKNTTNKVLLRSIKRDRVNINSYGEIKLSTVDTKPTSSAEFLNGAKVIIDGVQTANRHIYKLYRWGEANPRQLVLGLVTEAQELEDYLKSVSE
jgi:hypothetical protein